MVSDATAGGESGRHMSSPRDEQTSQFCARRMSGLARRFGSGNSEIKFVHSIPHHSLRSFAAIHSLPSALEDL